MRRRSQSPLAGQAARRGLGAVELAVLLPLLVFIFVVAIDFCRIFYFSLTVENCARNGALWACDAWAQAESPYANVTDAARADFPADVKTQLTVSDPAAIYSDGKASYVEVTCSYQFNTITTNAGITGPWTIRRVGRARVVP